LELTILGVFKWELLETSKRFVLVLMGLLFCWSDAQCQPYETVWSRTHLPCETNDEANDIKPFLTGFIVVGATYIDGLRNGFLQRLTEDGDTLWVRKLRPLGVHSIRECQITNQGDIIVVGLGGGSGIIGLKVAAGMFDSTGAEIWVRHYTEPQFHEVYRGTSICLGVDNGYVVAASSGGGSPVQDGLIFKIDEDGEPVWWQSFGGHRAEYADNILPVDNGYTVIGSRSDIGGDFYFTLTRYNANGDSLWMQEYAHGYTCDAAEIARIDSGYVWVGTTLADTLAGSSNNMIISRTDIEGNQLWESRIGTTGSDYADGVAVIGDSLIIVCGAFPNVNGYWDGAIVGLNSEGDSLWSQTFGGDYDDWFKDIEIVPASGLVLCGMRTNAPDCYQRDDWVLRLDEATSIGGRRYVSNEEDFRLECFPNPFNPSTTISFTLPDRAQTTLEVYNLLGQSVYSIDMGRLEAGQHHHEFDAATLPSGSYLTRLNAGDRQSVSKMVLVR
jgi:hypothetical protein